jgi:integrase
VAQRLQGPRRASQHTDDPPRRVKGCAPPRAVDELIPALPPFPRFHVDYVRRGFFEPEEAAAVIAELHEPLNDIARFAYSTGWRSEEVLGLEWSWINRTAGTITLPAEVEKTEAPRVVPYMDHPELVAVLERRWRRRALGCPLVFHRQGRAIVSCAWAWRSACERAGVPGRHFHDFRRTVLRDTVAGGADLGTAMALTGHRSVKTLSATTSSMPRWPGGLSATLRPTVSTPPA